jgi:hypothetical protein
MSNEESAIVAPSGLWLVRLGVAEVGGLDSKAA